MSLESIMAILVVLIVWAAMIYLNWRFGTGYGTRSVHCPHHGKRALISTSWFTDKGECTCDVLQCSLIPTGMPITCDKGCTAQIKNAH